MINVITNTATVTAFANNVNAVDTATITVEVAGTITDTMISPNLPNEGTNPNLVPGLPNNGAVPNPVDATLIAWVSMTGILLVLIIVFFLIRKKQ